MAKENIQYCESNYKMSHSFNVEEKINFHDKNQDKFAPDVRSTNNNILKTGKDVFSI